MNPAPIFGVHVIHLTLKLAQHELDEFHEPCAHILFNVLSCLVLSCLVTSCLVWSGLIWSALVCSGLVRSGPSDDNRPDQTSCRMKEIETVVPQNFSVKFPRVIEIVCQINRMFWCEKRKFATEKNFQYEFSLHKGNHKIFPKRRFSKNDF